MLETWEAAVGHMASVDVSYGQVVEINQTISTG